MFKSSRDRVSFGLILTLALMAPFVPPVLRACGGSFPSSALMGGDAGLLAAPVIDLHATLQRADIAGPPAAIAYPADRWQPETQTEQVGAEDLRIALEFRGDSEATIDSLVQQYQALRSALELFRRTKNGQPPEIPAGLPAEFHGYLKGAIAWHAGRLTEVRECFSAVLELPADQRRHRSVWATYMLGRTHQAESPETAIGYYQAVRELVREGFRDSLGLFAASFGWEARAFWDRGDVVTALELYLDQFATTDPTALPSIQLLTKSILTTAEDATLVALAKKPRLQRAVTAYLAARGGETFGNPFTETACAKRWLATVLVHAETVVPDDAARLAFLSYLSDDDGAAARWASLAKGHQGAGWILAKLHLKRGETEQAASLLAQLLRDSGDANDVPLRAMAPSLNAWESPEPTSQLRQMLADLGCLMVSKRAFDDALLAFMTCGHYWLDAAYLAERVLTLEELRSFVDRHWPESLVSGEEFRLFAYGSGCSSESEAAFRIRYLLARRLLRSGLWDDARPYLPATLRPRLASLRKLLSAGRDPSLARDARARALFDAATIVRHEGLELTGTALDPDWHEFDGQFALFPVTQNRQLGKGLLLTPTLDEMERSRAHLTAVPEKRWHYRYRALDLAWEATQLLPDQDEETARMLCVAGSWVKGRDPEAADRFYKAMVIRCGRTKLGLEAERRRWFPPLDPDEGQ